MSDEGRPDFARVYAAYHARILAYASRLAGPDEAEDIAQRVFVKVDRSLASLEDPAKLGSWIHAITLNAVRDWVRRRSAGAGRVSAGRASAPAGAALPARGHGEDGDPIADLVDATSRSPDEEAMRREMIACYLDYVERLPAPYHDVYVLRELEELTNAEIAGRLSLPVGTVKMRLHRARAILNEQLRCHCRLYDTERGELLGEPKEPPKRPA